MLSGFAWFAAPASGLAVLVDARWRPWWSPNAAPLVWPEAHPEVVRGITWTPAQPGVEWGELRLAGDGEAWRIRVIAVRIDPSRVRLGLAKALRAGGTLGAWTTDSLPPDAILGLNAGQFTGGRPWGWLVQAGREVQPPGRGPLSMAVVADTAGTLHLVPAADIAVVRERGGLTLAFQSYPVLLSGGGVVPPQLMAGGRGVDLAHRDARLAIGELRDGRTLIALTRFEGLGGALSDLPFGPTVPEMAALMGALGCHRAVMLDGGISSQLVLRETAGEARHWRGWRRVPLGLVVRGVDDRSSRVLGANGFANP